MRAALFPVIAQTSDMLKEQTITSTGSPHDVTGEHLEHRYCEIVREVYASIHRSSLDQFTLLRIDEFWTDLNTVLYELERLPEAPFQELIEVILRLREARNELRLARFLFDVEEINPIRCLILRNKAVLRGKHILQEVVLVWPLKLLSTTPYEAVT